MSKIDDGEDFADGKRHIGLTERQVGALVNSRLDSHLLEVGYALMEAEKRSSLAAALRSHGKAAAWS